MPTKILYIQLNNGDALDLEYDRPFGEMANMLMVNAISGVACVSAQVDRHFVTIPTSSIAYAQFRDQDLPEDVRAVLGYGVKE